MRFKYEPQAKTLPEAVRTKVRRRAVRHFQGKEVKHRVFEKDSTSITFIFNRWKNTYEDLPKNAHVTITLLG